jgi:hypothetical protein
MAMRRGGSGLDMYIIVMRVGLYPAAFHNPLSQRCIWQCMYNAPAAMHSMQTVCKL